jgi:hypothetical protein
MAHCKIVEFPMARPKICRTAQECRAVPLDRPIQVEIEIAPLTPTEKMHEALKKLDQARQQTIRAAEIELAQAEQLVLAKKEQLRQAHGGYRFQTVKSSLG